MSSVTMATHSLVAVHKGEELLFPWIADSGLCDKHYWGVFDLYSTIVQG